ncbi:MAG: hypothetical protein OQK97_02510 [Deltaproteobacteria bacterium]|jgi:hypothetical protein|nr:hypothetical protein [Deltaproteobacteria bacterium]MCW8893063.1 hypothetical protein [Deltaproteobacteria bacterium]
METKKEKTDLTADWEAICERCGRCCYEKYDYRGKIFYTNTPCRFLDTTTRQCRIYGQRSDLHPDCARLSPELARSGILPDDCPYAKIFAEISLEKNK